MVSMHLKTPRCTPPCLSEVPPNVAFETGPGFVCLAMALSRPFKEDRLTLPLSTHIPSRQSMVLMSLVLCPQVVSQAPQHFRTFETQATCDGCFSHQSVCSRSFLVTPACPKEYTHRRFKAERRPLTVPVWASHSTLKQREIDRERICRDK